MLNKANRLFNSIVYLTLNMYGITAGAVCHWSLKSQFLENVLFLITTLTIMNKFPYKFLIQMISTKLNFFLYPFHLSIQNFLLQRSANWIIILCPR